MNRMCCIIVVMLVVLIFTGCKDENITNNYGPDDWQPPSVEWLTAPEAEVRGTVGIDVSIHDSSAIRQAVLYFDGRSYDSLFAAAWRFEVHTDSFVDGVHLLEARARDEFGNLGISPVLRINVVNTPPQGPRVFWVPDNFERIQVAINAATHYDTIRVRPGIYYEALNTFGKGIWIESESGPLTCTINGMASNRVFTISPSEVPATIRGFWLTGANYGVGVNYSQVNLYNNIFHSDTAEAQIITSYDGGSIQNNLIDTGDYGVEIAYFWGAFFNNILQNVHNAAMWNAAIYQSPLVYDHNLFWHNGYNYDLFEPGIGDVYADPLLDLEHGILLAGSPARDAGNPDILDMDGTRSDIGPFGGPYAYNPQQTEKEGVSWQTGETKKVRATRTTWTRTGRS